MPPQILGPVTSKPYRCTTCGHVEQHSTNHYGEIYCKCPKCSWKNPMNPGCFECLSTLPEGWAKPEPWKLVSLGEVARVVRIKMRKE